MPTTLIRGGLVHDAVHRDACKADILLADGKIAAIGTDLTAPADAVVFDADGLEDLSRRDDDFAVTFGAGVAQDFNAPLQEILAIRRPAVVFAEDCTDITELEQLVRAREFAGCRFDERQRHIRPQDQDTAIGIDGLDHLLAELWKEVLVYIVIFKTRRFNNLTAVVHNDRNDFPLDPVIIAHFIMVEHLHSIQGIVVHPMTSLSLVLYSSKALKYWLLNIVPQSPKNKNTFF